MQQRWRFRRSCLLQQACTRTWCTFMECLVVVSRAAQGLAFHNHGLLVLRVGCRKHLDKGIPLKSGHRCPLPRGICLPDLDLGRSCSWRAAVSFATCVSQKSPGIVLTRLHRDVPRTVDESGGPLLVMVPQGIPQTQRLAHHSLSDFVVARLSPAAQPSGHRCHKEIVAPFIEFAR